MSGFLGILGGQVGNLLRTEPVLVLGTVNKMVTNLVTASGIGSTMPGKLLTGLLGGVLDLATVLTRSAVSPVGGGLFGALGGLGAGTTRSATSAGKL